MAKLSLYVKPGRINAEGKISVYVRISHKGKESLIFSGFNIDPKKIKNGSIVDIGLQAEIYAKTLLPLQDKLNKIVNVNLLTALEIKNIITANQLDKIENIDFLRFAQEHIQNCLKSKRDSTARNFQVVINSIKDFIKRDILFTNEITSNFLRDFSDYLQSSRKIKRLNHGKILIYEKPPVSPVSVNNYLRDFRTLFNACRNKYNDMDLGVINIPNYPFKNYNFKPVIKIHGFRAISIHEIRKIIALDIENLPNLAFFARDMYLLSFYLLGVNPGDLFKFTQSNIVGTRLEYQRSKTKHRADGAFISIQINEYASEILNRYKGTYVLLWLSQKYKNKQNCIRAVNNGLKIIAEKCNIDPENFTWYSARHTFASIARNECGYSLEDVAAALNHVGDHKITDGYIKRDWSVVDNICKDVMKKVFP